MAPPWGSLYRRMQESRNESAMQSAAFAIILAFQRRLSFDSIKMMIPMIRHAATTAHVTDVMDENLKDMSFSSLD